MCILFVKYQKLIVIFNLFKYIQLQSLKNCNNLFVIAKLTTTASEYCIFNLVAFICHWVS